MEKEVKSFRDAMNMAFEEEKKERLRRNRLRKWLKALMIFGVALSFSVGTILAFAKSLVCGLMVLGIVCMFPYWLYEFYKEC